VLDEEHHEICCRPPDQPTPLEPEVRHARRRVVVDNGVRDVSNGMARVDEPEERVLLLAERLVPLAETERLTKRPSVLEKSRTERHVRAEPDASEIDLLEPLRARSVDAKRSFAKVFCCGYPGLRRRRGLGHRTNAASRRSERLVCERRGVSAQPVWLSDGVIVDESEDFTPSGACTCIARAAETHPRFDNSTSMCGLGEPSHLLVPDRVIDDDQLVAWVVERTKCPQTASELRGSMTCANDHRAEWVLRHRLTARIKGRHLPDRREQ